MRELDRPKPTLARADVGSAPINTPRQRWYREDAHHMAPNRVSESSIRFYGQPTPEAKTHQRDSPCGYGYRTCSVPKAIPFPRLNGNTEECVPVFLRS